MFYKIAFICTEKISKIDYLDTNEKKVFIYSLENFFIQFFVFTSLLAIGSFLEKFLFMFTYICFFVLLRSFTGGFHCKYSSSCIILSLTLSIFSITLLPLIIKSYSVISIVCLFVSIVYIIKYAPIDHSQINLTNLEKKNMKKKTLQVITGEIVLILLFHFLDNTKELSFIGVIAIIEVAISMYVAKILKQEVEKNEQKIR